MEHGFILPSCSPRLRVSSCFFQAPLFLLRHCTFLPTLSYQLLECSIPRLPSAQELAWAHLRRLELLAIAVWAW